MVGGVNLCLELTPIPVRDTQRAQGLINPTTELPEPIQDWEFGLWMEVHAIVQETESKTIAKKKECKKAKWLSEEALQIAVKRREVKSKGEKERYTHLNAECQGLHGEIRKPSSVINAKK